MGLVHSEHEHEPTNRLFEVTPLSKYFAMALFIALPFIGGWIGYQYAPEKVVEVERIVSKEDSIRTDKNTESDLKDEYLASSFRTVAVVANPYYPSESEYDNLVIVSSRGVNDFTCGGAYVAPTCYLFLESSFAEVETPQFVGTWSSDFPALMPKTVEFISPTVVEFEARNGDAGYSVESVWRFDVTTGSSTEVSSREYFPD